MQLVIASHTEPPLPLPRLLAANNLTNITASDLQFTLEEAAEFLGGVTGLDLFSEYIAALEERTEGCIARLQLADLSMRGREDISAQVSTFSGTNRHIFDYLAEEVLDDQDEVTRAFLLRTSILDRLSGPLCDAVTGLGHGQTTLENLERMNLLMVPSATSGAGIVTSTSLQVSCASVCGAKTPRLSPGCIRKRASGTKATALRPKLLVTH